MRNDVIVPNTVGRPEYTAELEFLINRTKLLITQIFGFERVEVVLYDNGKVFPEPEDWESFHIDLVTPVEKVIGRLSLNDLPYNALGIEAKNTLNLIAKNFVDQLTDKLQLKNLSFELDHLKSEVQRLDKELLVAYEDLNVAHEELSEAANISALLSKNLSRKKLQVDSFLEQVPLAFALLRHRHLKIDIANSLILKVWGKERSIIGLPLATALPELEGQPYLDILDEVYTTGKRYVGREEKATLNDHGAFNDFYFNFIYEPLKNEQGNTHAIMIIATDVTEIVLSRNALKIHRSS